MNKIIKRIVEFCFIVVLAITLSSCTFLYKEKIVDKKETKENKNINLEEESYKREENLEKKIDEVIKNNEEIKTDIPIKKDENNNADDSSNKDQKYKEDNIQKETISKEKEIINKYKDKLYSIKAEYNGKINSDIDKAKGEYSSLEENEKNTISKVKIGLKYVKSISSLENECDSKVYSALDAMEGELKANKYSVEVVNIIRNYYEEEKEARKSYYMSKLK